MLTKYRPYALAPGPLATDVLRNGLLAFGKLGYYTAAKGFAKMGILYYDCDPARAAAAKRTLDVSGHYGRPDIFRLEVDRESRVPVAFE